jgi:hypothetical protein
VSTPVIRLAAFPTAAAACATSVVVARSIVGGNGGGKGGGLGDGGNGGGKGRGDGVVADVHRFPDHTGDQLYPQPVPVQLRLHMRKPISEHSCSACAYVVSRSGLPPMQLASSPEGALTAPIVRLHPASPLSDGSQH